VTIPIEEQISRVDRVKRVTSTTRQGVSIVQVAFEDNVSAEESARLSQQVRSEFAQVKLPEGTMQPFVDDFTSSDFMPMITVIVRGEADLVTINRAATDLRRRLLEIPDVSRAEIVGGRTREVRVEADRDKLEAFGVSLEEIVNAIKYHNLTIPGGTLKIGSRAYLLQTLGELTSAQQLDSVIVRRRPGKGSVSVSDVATVRNTMSEAPYDVRFNGEKAVALFVTKKSRGSSIAIVKQIKQVVADYRTSMPAGLSVSYFNDTSAIINEVVSVLGVNAIEGLIIVLLTLWPFFGWRESLITCLRIPVVFAITFLFMDWYGESLNGNSLFALVMVLGMVVSTASSVAPCRRRPSQEPAR
jgi:multidrug efflux pump subunit AcrB